MLKSESDMFYACWFCNLGRGCIVGVLLRACSPDGNYYWGDPSGTMPISYANLAYRLRISISGFGLNSSSMFDICQNSLASLEVVHLVNRCSSLP